MAGLMPILEGRSCIRNHNGDSIDKYIRGSTLPPICAVLLLHRARNNDRLMMVAIEPNHPLSLMNRTEQTIFTGNKYYACIYVHAGGSV